MSGFQEHQRAIEKFIQLFNEENFFEAHEVLETAWKAADEENLRTAYQGIIQIVAALVHLQKHNPAGAGQLYEKARLKLKQSPAVFLDGEKLLKETLAAIQGKAAFPKVKLLP